MQAASSDNKCTRGLTIELLTDMWLEARIKIYQSSCLNVLVDLLHHSRSKTYETAFQSQYFQGIPAQMQSVLDRKVLCKFHSRHD